MRALILGLTAVFFAGAANANPYEKLDYRSSDYSALAYYQVNFGSDLSNGLSQSLGLRFANEGALQAGAPALFRMEYVSGANVPTVAVNGLDLRVASVAMGLVNGDSFGLTAEQMNMVGMGVAGAVGLGFAIAVAGDSSPASSNKNPGGTGATGGSGGG